MRERERARENRIHRERETAQITTRGENIREEATERERVTERPTERQRERQRQTE
jgi:hypothetical protein